VSRPKSHLAKSHLQDPGRTRSGEWWVADEEPEVESADRSEGHSKWVRQRLAMLLGLAAAALFSAMLL
jgi:hypothetical protein